LLATLAAQQKYQIRRKKLERRRKYENERMKSYEWYCDVCKNGKNYTLRGKFMHLKTKNMRGTIIRINLL